ncbi:hypothetical protein PACTADRAFT_32060 [Pachysolen tannophilus NRRL Y-2460]|uniref:VASt domain-containing protein n=1 Tax=Pachysolen tannophilus NRRL Y-2460 TaxID=669874 RepID=A0A1E4TXT9_PACTA|nr:hypothetical protein PACTADRAFT_32060 [Pachysolen tannophilus NRRL Y-2460]
MSETDVMNRSGSLSSKLFMKNINNDKSIESSDVSQDSNSMAKRNGKAGEMKRGSHNNVDRSSSTAASRRLKKLFQPKSKNHDIQNDQNDQNNSVVSNDNPHGSGSFFSRRSVLKNDAAPINNNGNTSHNNHSDTSFKKIRHKKPTSPLQFADQLRINTVKSHSSTKTNQNNQDAVVLKVPFQLQMDDNDSIEEVSSNLKNNYSEGNSILEAPSPLYTSNTEQLKKLPSLAVGRAFSSTKKARKTRSNLSSPVTSFKDNSSDTSNFRRPLSPSSFANSTDINTSTVNNDSSVMEGDSRHANGASSSGKRNNSVSNEGGGLFSSFISAAQNAASHITSMGPDQNATHASLNGQTDDDDDKDSMINSTGINNNIKAKAEPKSKFSDVLSTIKLLASDAVGSNSNNTSFYLNNLYNDSLSQHIDTILTNKNVNETPSNMKPLSDSPIEDITKGITFKAVRKSQLNTLGKGDLNLSDFNDKNSSSNSNSNEEASEELQPAVNDNVPPRISIELPEETTKRPLLPQQETNNVNQGFLSAPVATTSNNNSIVRTPSAKSGLERKSISPRRRTLSPSFAKFSDSISLAPENIIRKKKQLHLKNYKKSIAASDDAVDYNSDTNDDGLSTLSPALSKVVSTMTLNKFDSKDITFANEKTQAEFHQIFKQISPKERLIEDYSCALQREILVQGRIYLSENHICFNSNILGWVKNFVIPLEEVIQIEKKTTAGVFPNAILVQTLHSKHIFASLLSRDSTFDLLTVVWNKNIHSAALGSELEGGSAEDVDLAGDDTESYGSEDSYTSGDDVDYDGHNVNVSDVTSDMENMTNESDKDEQQNFNQKQEDYADHLGGAPYYEESINGLPLVGPKTHHPTENEYVKKPNDVLICDEKVNGPLGVIYLLLFGDDSLFIKSTLEKAKNYEISDIPKMERNENDIKARSYSYKKPLNAPVGPKQTKCIITETVEKFDLNSTIHVLQTTQTPDVPSGNSFSVKTMFLLSWAENNRTRIVVMTSIDWTSKSWIKGAVERGTIDGQKEFIKIILSELKSTIALGALSTRKRTNTISRRKRASTKSRRKEEDKIKVEEADHEVKTENNYISMISDIISMIPASLRLPLGIFMFLLIVYLTLFRSAPSVSPSMEISGTSNVIINGRKYLMIPSDQGFNDENYLSNEMEYNIWNWIDDRNHMKKSTSNKKLQDKEFDIKDHHSRQNLEEMVRLMQARLDELRDQLD